MLDSKENNLYNSPRQGKGLYIKTYGCQMNVYDSEIISKLVQNLGYKTVDDMQSADLIILNTCHIREKAAEKIYSELGRINKQNKNSIVVVAGCVAQAEGGEIFKRAHNVDFVVGPQSLHTIPELITKIEREKGNKIKLDFDPMKKFDFLKEELKKTTDYKVSSFLSIQEGCDKFCTFCVVPYTRGAEFSRSVNDIYNEALNMVKNGVKEITLLGQNVNGYHGEINGREVSLGELIKYLAEINGLERIRYTTSHPIDMHEELYEAHKIDKVMPHMHLPVQSGSDRVLKRMNRKYTAAQYIDIIQKLRDARPDIAFSSDFIVGFPGETDEDFQKTLELVRKVKYAQSYSFKYSPRPGTPGAEYKQVDDDIKSLRLQALQELLTKQQLEFNNNSIGKIMPVLFEKTKNNQASGRTPYMQSVYIDKRDDLYGKIKNIKITESYQNHLKGEILDD